MPSCYHLCGKWLLTLLTDPPVGQLDQFLPDRWQPATFTVTPIN